MKRFLTFVLFAVTLAATLVSCKKEPVVLKTPTITGVVPTVSSAEVSWSAVDNASGYVLQLRQAGGSWADKAEPASSPATIEGLDGATEYEVRVKAKGSEGFQESDFSAAYSFTTLTPVIVLDKPTITSVVPAAKTAVVTWTAVPNATAYVLETSRNNGERVDMYKFTETTVTLTGLKPLSPYQVHVRATAENAESSEWSDIYEFNTTEVSFTYPLTIDDAEDFVTWINEKAADCTADNVITLGSDIDLTGKSITPVASFNGTFDGNGKVIKNAALVNALFAELGETGVVKNVNFDADSFIEWTEPIPDMTGISFVVSISKGQVINCSSAGKITVKTDTADRLYCAGIVGQSELGYVEGCKFTGSIDVELTGTSKSCSAIAGVVGRAGWETMAGKVIVKDCVNEGSINFLFSGPSKNMQKFGIGGVLGQTPSVKSATTDHGIVENCTNKGNITWSYPAGGSGSYPALGGVAGIIEGELKTANNYGNVTYTGGFDVAPTDASIGGVAGYVTRSASDCHNFGTVTTNSAFAGGTSLAQSGGNTSFSTFGGVFGNAGPYAADGTYCGDQGITIENCTNEGEVNLKCYMVNSGGPQMCYGGVVGASSANMVNCHNKKNVTIKTQTKTMNAGGVCGYLEANMDNCSNSGAIVLDGVSADNYNVTTAQAYFGGIFGMVTKGSTVNNVKNTGSVTFKDAITCDGVLSYVGGIGGSYKGSFILSNSENTGAVTSESASPICLGGLCGAYNGEMSNCKNSGKVAYTNSYISPTDGKQAEVGGLIGYANAYLTNCENTGNVTCTPAGGFAGGLIASHGANTNQPVIIHKGCSVNCSIEGEATKGSILGKFRYAPKSDFALTSVAFGTDEAPCTIAGGAASLPFVGDVKGHNAECLAAKAFWYGGKQYPVVKLADGKWWMAGPLAYVPEGKTVSSDPKEDSGIWYSYKVEGGVAVPLTDKNDGYLYDYPTAMGKAANEITFGTQSDWQSGNYRDFEGAQGICPPGWYIPTRADFLKLVGSSNKDDTRGETAAVDDPTALYYVTACKGSSVKRFNEAGWNFSFLGARNKTSNTATGAYNVTVTDASKCSVAEWIGNPALNQVMSSTAYKPNVAGTSFQYFCMMSTFTSAYMDGRLTLSYAQYLQGVEVRCVRKAE